MPVSKVIGLIGSSTRSIEDAVAIALSRASLTLRGIKSIEVERVTATVEDNQVKEWHVEVKVAFTVLDQVHE